MAQASRVLVLVFTFGTHQRAHRGCTHTYIYIYIGLTYIG